MASRPHLKAAGTDDSFDATFLINTPSPAERVLSTRALRGPFAGAAAGAGAGKAPTSQEKGKSVRFGHEEKEQPSPAQTTTPAPQRLFGAGPSVGGGGEVFGGSSSTPHRDVALSSTSKRSPGAGGIGSWASTPSQSTPAPIIKSSASSSIYPPLPSSFATPSRPGSSSVPSSLSRPSTTSATALTKRGPSTPQLTKQSVLVPISLKGGTGGVRRVGAARMAQRLRVNLVALLGYWILASTRGYRYVTGAFVLALPAADTPLFALEWLFFLVLLFNVIEAVYKLKLPSASPTSISVPMSPQQRIQLEQQQRDQAKGNGIADAWSIGRPAKALPITKQSPLTRPSTSSSASKPGFSLMSSTSPASPQSPLNLMSPLPKVRASTSSTSLNNPPGSAPRTDVLRRSTVGNGSPLRHSILGTPTNANGQPDAATELADDLGVYVAKHSSPGGKSGFGTSTSRRVSDRQAVERLVAEAF